MSSRSFSPVLPTSRGSRYSLEAVVAVLVTVGVSVVRFWLAEQAKFCGTPDACAYLGLARSLGTGRGFQARYLFDLQQDVLSMPSKGIEYWRAGTSFFLLLAKPFGGVTLASSVVVTILAGVALAAAAWYLAMKTTGSRRLALASYLLCLLLPPSWNGTMSPDSALFYGMGVAWFLALFTVRRQGLWQDVLALVFAGVTYAIRNDGVLLLLPLVAVLWQRRRSGELGAGYAAGMLAGFALVMAPVHLLNWHVLGQAFPSGVGKALYLDNFDELLLYRQKVNLHTLLATGAVRLVKIRVVTLVTAVYRMVALEIGFAAVFLPALWVRRGAEAEEHGEWMPELTGGVAFLMGMVGLYVLLMPVIGEFSMLRSFVGVLPLVAVALVSGIARVVRNERQQMALMVSILVAYLVMGVMANKREAASMAMMGDGIRLQGKELREAGRDPEKTVVMTSDPTQLAVTTGFGTVPFPSNGFRAMRGLSDEVGVTDVLVYPNLSEARVQQMREALQPQSEALLPASGIRLFSLPDRRSARGVK